MIVNPTALALLDFLGSQQQGKLPNELGDVMSLVIDATELIRARNAQVIGQNFNALTGTTFNTGAGLSVPAAEAWYVHNCSLHGTNASAGTNVVTLRMLQDGNALDLDDSQSIAAGAYASRCMKVPPFWMRPGCALGYGNEGTGTASMTVIALVSKFRSGA